MDSLDIRRERGGRFKQIRDALNMRQHEFAAALNKEAKRLRLDVSYDVGDISARETGRKALDVEDYATAGALDARRWPWFWIAFGRKEFEGQRAQPELPLAAKPDAAVRGQRDK